MSLMWRTYSMPSILSLRPRENGFKKIASIVLIRQATWPELLRYSRYSQRAHTQ